MTRTRKGAGGDDAGGSDGCHRTDQFIRAQVQKQSPKRSNSRT